MKTLFEILALRRPHGGKNERYVAEHILTRLPYELEVFEDKAGQPMAYTLTTDPASKTLFVAHLDTVHHDELTPNPVVFDEVKQELFKADGTPLGADCGSGVWMLYKMAEAGVPGTYLWTLGEEKGGVGAKWMSDYAEDFLKNFDRAVAFDRRGTDSVITHQGWTGRCCSDEFARALAHELSTGELMFAPDPTGVYTDTAEFTVVVSECTNVSTGYNFEHSANETQDVAFLEKLLARCIEIDWEGLPTRRDPSVIDSDWGFNYGWGKPANEDQVTWEDLYGKTEEEVVNLCYDYPDEVGRFLYEIMNEKEVKELDEKDEKYDEFDFNYYEGE